MLLGQCQRHAVVLTVCCAACSGTVLFPYLAAVLFVRGTCAEPCPTGGTTAGQGGQHVRHAAEGSGGSPQGERQHTQRRTEHSELLPPPGQSFPRALCSYTRSWHRALRPTPARQSACRWTPVSCVPATHTGLTSSLLCRCLICCAVLCCARRSAQRSRAWQHCRRPVRGCGQSATGRWVCCAAG